MRYRKNSLRGAFRDFLVRLVAFTILCALGLAWVKFHFLDGTWVRSDTSADVRGNAARSKWSANPRRPAPKTERTGGLASSF